MRGLAREVLRWYLSRSPVTEGKGFLYRSFAEALLPKEREIVVSLVPGFRMGLDLAEAAQREIFYFGTYERKESILVRRLLRPGDVFWDVGANLGYYTLLGAACVGSSGRVVAFEPFPPAWRCLQENLRLNGFPHVRCVQEAASDKAGQATLFYPRNEPEGVASLLLAGHGLSQVACETLTLDGFLATSGERPPLLIKVDVEGAEMAVITGAAELLSGGKAPMLLVETEDSHVTWQGATRSDLQDVLSRWGFVAYHLRSRGWLRCDDVRRVRFRNLFWLQPGNPLHRERGEQAGVLT